MYVDEFVFEKSSVLASLSYVSITGSRTASVTEGDSGERYAIFKIGLSAASSETVSVRVNTYTYASGSWATEGVDYDGIHRTLTFQPGELTKTIRVKIIGDTEYEASELFGLTLSDVKGALPDPDPNLATGYVWINNDDPAEVASALWLL